MSEDGYSLLEALFVLSILLVISGIGAWKFMLALQAITELLALLKKGTQRMGLFKNVPLQINEPPDDEQQSEYYVNADRFAEGTRVLFTIDKPFQV